MIESLYQFLLENEKYDEIVFGKGVMFRGEIENYFKMIGLVSQQDSLSHHIDIRIEISGQSRSKIQIIAELTLKKIFEELIVKNAKIECRKENKIQRFIVKEKKYVGEDVEGWIKLVQMGRI